MGLFSPISTKYINSSKPYLIGKNISQWYFIHDYFQAAADASPGIIRSEYPGRSYKWITTLSVIDSPAGSGVGPCLFTSNLAALCWKSNSSAVIIIIICNRDCRLNQ